jgi:ketosteroid isomerase-like protein
MKLDNASDLVRKCFSAWETKDREALKELLAEDFTFTSPNDDDHISKDEYWKKCWPGSEKIRAIHIEKLFEKGDEAFVRYECELKDGARFRNTEYLRIEGNKIKEVEVYFGSSVTTAAADASGSGIEPTRKSGSPT